VKRVVRELTRAVEYTLASLASSMLGEHREEFASSEVASALLSCSVPCDSMPALVSICIA
jgi:hypothetical protein